MAATTDRQPFPKRLQYLQVVCHQSELSVVLSQRIHADTKLDSERGTKMTPWPEQSHGYRQSKNKYKILPKSIDEHKLSHKTKTYTITKSMLQ